MSRWTPPLSINQQKAIAIIPKITATPSFIGSCYIAQHVARSPKRRRLVYHRILIVMSCMDMMASFKSFMSTWPSPKYTNIYGAVGTTESCTAFGFLGHGSSLSSALYNGSLTMFFLLTIKYNWTEERIKSRMEPWLHVIPLSVGWGTAIAGLPLLLYNPIGWTCWIGPWPIGCQTSGTCERGENAGIYRWVFFHAELWAIFVFTVVAMYMIYAVVVQHEKTMKRYSSSHGSENKRRNRERSKRFAHQALLYLLAYYITWVFPMVQWVIQQSSNKTYTPILMLQAFFVPLQGFWNVLIYMRPRYLRYRRRHPEMSAWQVWKQAFVSARRQETIWAAGGDDNFREASSSEDSDQPSMPPTVLKRMLSSVSWVRRGSSSSVIGPFGKKESESSPSHNNKKQTLGAYDANPSYDVFVRVENGAAGIAVCPSEESASSALESGRKIDMGVGSEASDEFDENPRLEGAPSNGDVSNQQNGME